MSNRIDLTGNKFGRLTVLSFSKSSKGKTYWNCKCDCGNEVVVRGDHMKRKVGPTHSCGCLARENSNKLSELGLDTRFTAIHGDSKSRFYKIYLGMKDRCTRNSHPNYHNYGGRGIIVEWKSYEEFKKDMYESYLKHLEDFGEENTTIERINIDGNYTKENCTWVTKREQSYNRQNTVHVLMGDGSKIPLPIISEKTGIKLSCLRSRYRNSKYNGTKEIPYNDLIKENDIV